MTNYKSKIKYPTPKQNRNFKSIIFSSDYINFLAHDIANIFYYGFKS